MGVGSDGDRERPPKTKVSNLEDLGGLVYQQILRLQITMHHAVLVAVSTTLQQLVHEALHCRSIFSQAPFEHALIGTTSMGPLHIVKERMLAGQPVLHSS